MSGEVFVIGGEYVVVSEIIEAVLRQRAIRVHIGHRTNTDNDITLFGKVYTVHNVYTFRP